MGTHVSDTVACMAWLPPPFPSSSQILFAVGVTIAVFEMVVKSRFIQRIGMRRSHRWGSAGSTVVFLLVPFLSRLHDTGLPLIATSFTVLLVFQACANAVRGCGQCTVQWLADSTLREPIARVPAIPAWRAPRFVEQTETAVDMATTPKWSPFIIWR